MRLLPDPVSRFHRRSRRGLGRIAAVLCICAVTAAADGGDTTRVSVDAAGSQAALGGVDMALSGNGRYVVYLSGSTDLVPDDTNARNDVFRRDLRSGEVIRVSVGDDEAELDNGSARPQVSFTGRYVMFATSATNVVPGPSGTGAQVYVRDVERGTTVRASVNNAGESAEAGADFGMISATGRFVLFVTSSANLDAGDLNGVGDMYLRDIARGTTTRVSVAHDGGDSDAVSGFTGAVSADGRYVSFVSTATNLVEGDTNGRKDVFLRDVLRGKTTRISVAKDGTQGDADVGFTCDMDIAARRVVFASSASNLVPGDTNGRTDTFVYTRGKKGLNRVSVSSGGAESDGNTLFEAISGNGRVVIFASDGTTLVPGDVNGLRDTFVHDIKRRKTTLVSVATDGTQADAASNPLRSIDRTGRRVAFHTPATNLVPDDTNGAFDVFVRDLRK